MKRREFAQVFGAALAAVVSRPLSAQQGAPGASQDMDAGAHRPVRLPPRSGAANTLDGEQVKQLELQIACQCGCRRDVYNCRTTDFQCQVSPAMHRDVLALAEGGYDADEIMAAFVDVYGERARMAPKAEGFYRFAYLAPYIATGGAAVLVGIWIARQLRRSEAPASDNVFVPARGSDATSEELERIERAMRESEQ